MDPIKLVEKIKANAPSFTSNGVSYYVVERDRKVKESDLLAYAQEMANAIDPAIPPPAAMERLVVATVGDRPIRWEMPVVLRWSIDKTSFAGHDAELAVARSVCGQATADWNEAAREQGIYDQVHFEENDDDPVFTFTFCEFDDPSLYAVAFFPNNPANERVVNIGPTTFVEPNDFDPVGVIRHELGHVLGFRHEHIRADAQAGMDADQIRKMERWVTDGLGAEELTDYDSQSVMHYPLNNRGTTDFQLTDVDKTGFGKLYSLPTDPETLREFPI